MNKRYCFSMAHGGVLLVTGLSVMLAASCSKDADYDALTESDGIDLKMALAPGGLTLPFGSLDSIFLTELLDTAEVDVLREYPNGEYYIQEDGDIDETTFSVATSTLNIDPQINPASFQFAVRNDNITPEMHAFMEQSGTQPGDNLSSLGIVSVSIANDNVVFDQNTRFDLRADNVDEAFIEARSVDFAEPVEIRVNMVLTQLPRVLDAAGNLASLYLDLNNVRVEMPPYIVLDGETAPGVVGFDHSELIVPPGATEAVWDTVFTARRLEFTDARDPQGVLKNVNGLFERSGEVVLDGQFVIKEALVAGSDLLVHGVAKDSVILAQDIQIHPILDIDDVVLQAVTGRFDPQIDDVTAAADIDLSDDMDFLTDKQTSLDLDDPQLFFTIRNTSSVKLFADVVLEGDNGRRVSFADVLVSPEAGQTERQIVLTRVGKGGDYENDDLGRFLSPIPRHVDVIVKPRADSENEYVFTLGEDVIISGDYKLEVPLRFNDVNLHYEEVIEDVFGEGEDAEDLTDMLPSIQSGQGSEARLTLDVTNAVPVDLKLSLSANGYDGQEHPDYVTFDDHDVTIENGTTAAPKVTHVELNVGIPDTKKVKDLILVVNGQGENESLSARQYLKIDNVKLRLKGQVLDFNDKD